MGIFGRGAVGVSRRNFLTMTAAGAAASVLPLGVGTRIAVAKDGGAFKMINSSPANLLLWSVTFLSEDMGFYKEEGLEFERIGLGGGPTAMTALVAGEGDALCSAPGEGLAAIAAGQKLKIIEGFTLGDAYTLVVTKAFADKLGVTGASSLQEREAALRAAKKGRFGVTAPGSQTDLTTRLALAQVGLDAASDVQIVPMGNIVNVTSGLSQGAVDAGVLLAPFTEQTIAEFGVVPLLSVAGGDIPAATRMQGQVLEARPQDVADRPELFAAIVKADLRSLRMIQETPDEARDLLRKTRFGNVDETIWPEVWTGQLPTFKTPYVTADGLRAWIETGSIGGNPDPNTFPYDEVIDMSFVDKGLADLGWKI